MPTFDDIKRTEDVLKRIDPKHGEAIEHLLKECVRDCGINNPIQATLMLFEKRVAECPELQEAYRAFALELVRDEAGRILEEMDRGSVPPKKD